MVQANTQESTGGCVMKVKQGTIKRIHVNQHNIRHNAKSEDKKPVFTCKTGGNNYKADAVHIYGSSALVYSPDKPLDCGAKVWIQTTAVVELFDD